MVNKNKGKRNKKSISLSRIFKWAGEILFVYAIYRLSKFFIVGSTVAIVNAGVYMKEEFGDPRVLEMLPGVAHSLGLTAMIFTFAAFCIGFYLLIEIWKKNRR